MKEYKVCWWIQNLGGGNSEVHADTPQEAADILRARKPNVTEVLAVFEVRNCIGEWK